MADDLASLLGTPELGQPAPMPAAPAAPLPGGVQRNNPLNLRPLPAGSWPGQSGIDGGFASFDTPESGWSAADQNLLAQINRHGARSIGDVVSRWAPASDHNDPNAYAARVAGELGIGPADDVSQRILTDADFRHRVLSSMAGVETGKPQAYGGAGASDLATMLGMDAQAPAPATAPDPKGPQPGTYKGGEGMTAPQQAASQTIQTRPGFNPQAIAGTPENPYFLKPGYPIPTGPTVHWVDLNGHEHINPGGLAEQAGSVLQGFGQGAGMDTVASASRLTGGGMAVGDPMAAALSQSQGGPSALDIANAAQQGASQQQQQYAAQHTGDPYAQVGRFVGQALPATAAAAAVPEVIPLDALGNPVVRAGAGAINNALRGVAATAPSVGANPDVPVTQQLAVGAAGGAALPAIFGGAVKAGAAVTGLGRTVSPEVASLADLAQSKYGIDLRSGQVMGANGDRAAATADSNMLGYSGKSRANNEGQRQQWMKGVTGTYGDATGDVSPDALSAARARIGAVMDGVAARSTIADADALQTRFGQIIHDAQSVLPDNEVTPLLKQVEAIAQTRQGNSIPGDAYQALTRRGAPLDRLESSTNPNVSFYAGQMREALDDALQASARPEDVQALQNARFQYKNLMTVAKLAPKADTSGVISPALLRGAVASNFKNQAFKGAGDLGELAQIGQVFMKEPPNSFSADRAKDILGSLGAGLTTAGAADIGLTLLHQPQNALAPLVSAGAGAIAKNAFEGLKANRIGGSASNIIKRSLPGAPGAVRSAFDGILNTTRPLQVPLSALSGVRALNTFEPASANAVP